MSGENGAGGTGDDAVSAEEFKAMVERVAKLEEEKKKLEEKDLNFGKLRRMKESEISGAKKRELDEKEEELESIEEKLKAIENEVDKKHKDFVEQQFSTAKDKRLNELSGDDTDFKDKILFHYERLKDPIASAEDIYKKLNDAYILATGEAPTVNPLRSILSGSSSYGSYKTKKVDYSRTEQGKDMLKSFFPHLAKKIDSE